MTTIFDLIDAGDADGVRALVREDPAAAAARDEQGLSAVMRASYRGPALVDAVRSADPPLDPLDRIVVGEPGDLPAPDARTPDGFTGLHLAAFAGNAEAARRLLEAGAAPNVLATASFAQVTPLGTSAFTGANDVARLLLEHGADTELTSDQGGTPLHSAAANGNRELVEMLLAHGASAQARTDNGETPADVAASDEIRAVLGER
jgi:ankyrin repeat protein